MNDQGQLLLPKFFPCGKISQVGVKEVQLFLIQVFTQWGKPKWIKVDNGRPLGDPLQAVIPTLSLWLIGMGIEVHFNKPRTPQQNAKVERCQGTLSRWTEYDKCQSTQELQERLAKESHFYNCVFKDRRHGNQTRIQRFPTLENTTRLFNAENFELTKVLDRIASTHSKRKVDSNGRIRQYSLGYTVGKQYRGQTVTVNLDPMTREWIVRNDKGDLLKRSPSKITEANIKSLLYGNRMRYENVSRT